MQAAFAAIPSALLADALYFMTDSDLVNLGQLLERQSPVSMYNSVVYLSIPAEQPPCAHES